MQLRHQRPEKISSESGSGTSGSDFNTILFVGEEGCAGGDGEDGS